MQNDQLCFPEAMEPIFAKKSLKNNEKSYFCGNFPEGNICLTSIVPVLVGVGEGHTFTPLQGERLAATGDGSAAASVSSKPHGSVGFLRPGGVQNQSPSLSAGSSSAMLSPSAVSSQSERLAATHVQAALRGYMVRAWLLNLTGPWVKLARIYRVLKRGTLTFDIGLLAWRPQHPGEARRPRDEATGNR